MLIIIVAQACFVVQVLKNEKIVKPEKGRCIFEMVSSAGLLFLPLYWYSFVWTDSDYEQYRLRFERNWPFIFLIIPLGALFVVMLFSLGNRLHSNAIRSNNALQSLRHN